MSIDNTTIQDIKPSLHTDFREVFINSNIQYYKKVFEDKIVVGYTAIRRPALATELTEAIELYKDLK